MEDNSRPNVIIICKCATLIPKCKFFLTKCENHPKMFIIVQTNRQAKNPITFVIWHIVYPICGLLAPVVSQYTVFLFRASILRICVFLKKGLG